MLSVLKTFSERLRMAYDEDLAQRIRRLLHKCNGVSEKKMFGGLAFLRDGKMFCGITTHDLMVRVGPARHQEALAQPHVRPMDFTGRPMRGYVFVGQLGLDSEAKLSTWVKQAYAHVDTVKAAKKKTR